MYKANADNIECNIYLNRLREYISITDVCNYLEIRCTDLTRIKHLHGSDEYKPEKDRDESYHLQKIKHLIDSGITKPIDIDCFCRNGVVYPWPVIQDGRHRYLSALLRGDKFILATYSGRKDLMDYLTFKNNHKPLVCTTLM